MGRVRDYLKAVTGQLGLQTPVGQWAQKITDAIEALIEAQEQQSTPTTHPPQSGSFVQTQYSSLGPGQLLANGSNIVFDAAGYGDIAYNNASGVFTLAPNTTYRLTAHFALSSFSGETVNFGIEWVDANSNLVLHDGHGAFLTPGTNTNSVQTQPTAETFHTTGPGGQTVKLRVTGATGTATALGGLSYALVEVA
jgi:hypothetical protein